MIKDYSLKTLKVMASVFLILGAIYLVGPRVETPEFSYEVHEVPENLVKLQNWINEKEISQGNVRPGNASKIIFNDSIPQKTEYSVIYFHGFTASGIEGDPVHRDIANALGANLYIPRLFGHGLEEEESMLNFNNNDFWKSGKQALEVAKKLGEKVIILGTSHGGSLALALGDDPSIEAMLLFGPNIAVFDPKAKLMRDEFGLDGAMIGRASIGNPWFFDEVKHFLATGTHAIAPNIEDRVEVARRHLEMAIGWKGETQGVLETRRHYTNYFKGIPNFKPLRTRMVTSNESAGVFEVFNEILEQFSSYETA